MKETERRSIGYTESKIRPSDLLPICVGEYGRECWGSLNFLLGHPPRFYYLNKLAGWRSMLIRYDFYSDAIRHLVDNFIQDILDNVVL